MLCPGIHGFKPYVHSDCGGDYRSSSGDLLRWIAHCVFGTILRLHGSDHRPWSYGSDVEDQIRNWLQLRYSMIPSLITAGTQASISGFPLVARADLFWPEHYEAADSSQYIHLNGMVSVALINQFLFWYEG
jgi:alpha-glucosidase (family GH31 glycosyl hydrolase)